MNIFQRLGRLFKWATGWLIDWGESKVPVERKLATRRQEKVEKFHRQEGRADKVGTMAHMMVQTLAKRQVEKTNLEAEIEALYRDAAAAQQAGNLDLEKQLNEEANQRNEDLVALEADLETFSKSVNVTLAGHQKALGMVKWYEGKIRSMSMQDAGKVARMNLAEMTIEAQELQEEFLNEGLDETDDIGAQVEQQVEEMEAKAAARQQRIDMRMETSERQMVASRRHVSVQASAKAQELQRRAGYKPTTAQPATATNQPPDEPEQKKAGASG